MRDCDGKGVLTVLELGLEEMKTKMWKKKRYYEGRAWHFCLAFGVRRTDDELALAWDTWIATKIA